LKELVIENFHVRFPLKFFRSHFRIHLLNLKFHTDQRIFIDWTVAFSLCLFFDVVVLSDFSFNLHQCLVKLSVFFFSLNPLCLNAVFVLLKRLVGLKSFEFVLVNASNYSLFLQEFLKLFFEKSELILFLFDVGYIFFDILMSQSFDLFFQSFYLSLLRLQFCFQR
jgi:hypothetical protein